MIETILIFALGFFVAGFLALMAAPAVWRCAVHLTQKRIEASMPLSINELEAEKDRLRAGHAMTARKLEMTVAALNRKLAARQVEAGELEEEVHRLRAEREEQEEALSVTRSGSEEQQAELDRHNQAIADLLTELEAAQAGSAERDTRIARLQEQHEEERLAASSRQIELVARETEVLKLEDELAVARQKNREARRETREAVNARRAAEAALRVEKKRNSDLQEKLEAMMTRLSDHEERLHRRESEIARLRGKMNEETGMKGASVEDVAVERERLQERLAALMEENGKLRGENRAQDDDAVREEIRTLAAEMVNLTAALEGPESPIEAALAKVDEKASDDRPASLAGRVKALREAVGSGPDTP